MPRNDKGGPAGRGPRTGRGFGNCESGKGGNPQRERVRAGQNSNSWGRGRGCCSNENQEEKKEGQSE